MYGRLLPMLMFFLLLPNFVMAQDDAQTLRSFEIKNTQEAVTAFLQEIVQEKRPLLNKQQAAEMVARLGARDFIEREKATKILIDQFTLPLDLLQVAARSSNPEQARRAQKILVLGNRPDPIVAALRQARLKQWNIDQGTLLALIITTDSRQIVEWSSDLLAIQAKNIRLDMARQWLASKNPRQIATGARILPLLTEAKNAPESLKLLEHPDEGVRFAVARGLCQRSKPIEFGLFKETLNAESYARLLVAIECDFRIDQTSQLNAPAAMAYYRKVHEQYIAALQACNAYKKENRQPTNDMNWLNISLNTSSKPEILAYRIRWFSGTWSEWYTPGFGDVHMDGEKPDPRRIRHWACFSDHEFDVILATRPDQHRYVVDVE